MSTQECDDEDPDRGCATFIIAAIVIIIVVWIAFSLATLPADAQETGLQQLEQQESGEVTVGSGALSITEDGTTIVTACSRPDGYVLTVEEELEALKQRVADLESGSWSGFVALGFGLASFLEVAILFLMFDSLKKKLKQKGLV